MNPNNRNSWQMVSESLRLLEEPDTALSPHRRGRIVREAMAARALAGRNPAGWQVPAMAWISAIAVAAIVVLVPPAWLSGPEEPGSVIAGSGAGPRLVMADYQDGQMIVEWANGNRESFTVRQANDVREARLAPGVEVEGHRFVDPAPSDERVVFYVVE